MYEVAFPRGIPRVTDWSLLVGVFIAFAFVQPSDIQDMHAQLTLLMDQYDLNLPQLPDFDFSRLEVEWSRIRSNIPEVWKFNTDGREFQVGENMADRGLTAKYPVVLIPGVISTVSLISSHQVWTCHDLVVIRDWNHGQHHQIIARSSAKRCGVVSICSLKSLLTATNGFQL